jgi:hypothetical protein
MAKIAKMDKMPGGSHFPAIQATLPSLGLIWRKARAVRGA